MKSIYIILTKTNTIFAKGIRVYTQEKYSHSSICLNDDFKEFYSFGRKNKHNPFIGCFVKETLDGGLYSLFSNIPCKILKVEVTKKQYDLILNKIKIMEKEMEKYKYNYKGIIYATINKPYHSQYRYYCSEFVYYLLKVGQVLTNEFDDVCIKPTDFDKLGFKVVFEGNLHEINIKNIV